MQKPSLLRTLLEDDVKTYRDEPDLKATPTKADQGVIQVQQGQGDPVFSKPGVVAQSKCSDNQSVSASEKDYLRHSLPQIEDLPDSSEVSSS